MRAVRTASAAITLIAALAGCERDRPAPPPPVEPPALGTTPPPPGVERPRTLAIREVCRQVGGANCARAAACTGIDAVACLEVVMAECCADEARCDSDSGYSPAEVGRCADAFAALHCRAIERQDSPAACAGMMAP